MAADSTPLVLVGDGPWMLRVYGWNDETLHELGERFEHFTVFEEKGLLLIQVDDRAELGYLSSSGLRLEVDARGTATLREIGRSRARGSRSISAIPGFECYRTVEETLATGAALAAENPTLASWIDIGDSWEKINRPPAGHDIWALRLTNSAVAGDKPALLVTGSIHPREYTTSELVTRFAEDLVAGYGVDADVTWILDHHEVHLVLVVNPDGRVRAETGLSWRKNADDDFCTGSNSRGVDLNRNFDFQWGCCGGSSGSECATTFRGPSAASEPESQAIRDYMLAIFPDQRPDDLTTPASLDSEGIFLDLHSPGQVMLSSWGFTDVDPPNAQEILTLGRKYSYFPGYSARLGSLGTVDGATKDFAYGRLGVPAYTVELGTTFFEECSVFESAVVPGNLEGLLHIAKNVRTPYVTPAGPDTIDLGVPSLPVTAGQLVPITATVDDTRYDGPEPGQNILSAELYVDLPPWQGGLPIALVAADGAFDQPVESVAGSLDTSGLAPGRHILLIRGEDATGTSRSSPSGGTFGAFSGAFLFVIDPASAPTLEGAVRADGGEPLAATVTVGPFHIHTDLATGIYSQQLPGGTYEVTAAATGHAAATATIQLEDFQTLELDFRLQPLVAVLDDDVEAGNVGWTADPPWGITQESFDSPTHSWTDSPGGDYGDETDVSLTSPRIDLSGLEGVRLSFAHIYDFETGFDSGTIEVSTDNASWTAVSSFSQESQVTEWTRDEVLLPMLDGLPAAWIRFRVRSDGDLTRDGWYLDDIRLEATVSALIFADGFESGDTSAW